MYKRFRTACTIYQAPFKGLSLLITLAIYLSLPVNNAMNFHWAQECQTLWVQDKRKCSHYSRRISMLPRTEDWIMLISHAPRSLKPNLVSRVWVTDRDGPRGTTKSSDKNKQTKNQQNRHIKIAAEHAPKSILHQSFIKKIKEKFPKTSHTKPELSEEVFRFCG